MTLNELYEARLDSPRSINYYGEFDCFCETVFFSLCDGDTGESLKSYEVSFDEETGEVDNDMEFTSNYDSGYCDFRRLPKCVREHVLAIVVAYMKEQAEETAEMEATEEVGELKENAITKNLSNFIGINTMTLAQQYDELLKSRCSEYELGAFAEQHIVSIGGCDSEGIISFSRIFADGSVWGYSMVFRYDTERDNFGYNTVVEHQTIYCQ